MKKICRTLTEKWYWLLFAAVILGEAAVFLFFGEGSYIATHDNLDLFMGHFQAMKYADAFFAHDVTVPVLGGISRDYLSSEFSLYNILFWLFPPFAAYMCGYFLKILIAAGSVMLLAKDIYRDAYRKYEPAAVIIGLIYGLLPLFPAYGIAFASFPLRYSCFAGFTEGRAGGIICSFSCIRCFLIFPTLVSLSLPIWYWLLLSLR